VWECLVKQLDDDSPLKIAMLRTEIYVMLFLNYGHLPAMELTNYISFHLLHKPKMYS